uniref:Desmoplakin n=1 Tax=Oncorhynchus kisutch TaxID=8019 RepID=A0A8C7I032_ONCKI
ISMYGSQSRLPTMIRRTNSRPDLTSGSFTIPRNDGSQVFVGGNGYQQEYGDGYTYSQTYSKSSLGGGGGGGAYGGGSIQKKALFLKGQCQEYLQRVQQILQARGPAVEVDKLMTMSSETIDQLNECAIELQQMRQPNDIIIRSMQSGIISSISGTTQRQSRGSIGWEERGRSYADAMSWIGQQKRLIETSPWGDDAATIEQQILSQNKLHSSIQRSHEVDHARDELAQKDDKGGLHSLQQEWDSLQKMSFARTGQLRELQNIIEEISRAIMWVNEREEEELVFNWGDKNIDVYIPKKQESYSKLMSALEEKEKELNKLKQKVDGLLKNNHPASDKIEAYMDTLQTQWSWLLQITKCIHVHLKENAAYSQFFKEANETYSKLQKDHEIIRKKFTCDKGTPLENLTELLKNLEREKERVMENKRQVKHLVNKSKSIVRLRPRNPEEKSSTAVIVQALCDFKQDQKGILKGDEGILKDNSQRSKWQVTGPGGLDMLIPSVCLLIPPLNPLSIGLANKNEQYYEAIMGIWNQLYINIKSLISWQYCVKDINHINSLTLTMLSQMRPEEYRNIIKSLETHYQEFLRNSHGSEMFGEDEKKKMEGQYSGAQSHYDTLVIGLPTYSESKGIMLDPEPPIKANTTKITHTSLKETSISTQGSNMSLTLLSDLQALRRRLELAESGLSHHLHVSLGENSVQECSQHLLQLEGIHNDLDGVRDEYLRLRERVVKQLEGTAADSEQAKFLRKELDLLNQKLGDLQGLSSAYLQRLSYLQNLLQSLIQAEDVIKVLEARLTEKETTSLDLNELERYRATLKQMKSDLEHKRDLLTAMESDLANAVHVNSQISASLHKCDVDLSKYSELVTQMSDRWRRIQTQIDSRVWDLEKQEKQLRHFQQSSGVVDQWIDNARQRQDTLQTAKFSNIQAVMEHLNQQKVLHSEIKGKKEKVEDVQKDADTCAASIKDYELQLASYSAGLETLLNIPIKRTMLQSPATVVRQEGADLQSRYIELLTRSSDYYKFLGEMLKNMEELKIRNTKIEMLEEELRRLKEDIGGHSQKNRSLEDALSRYKLELSQSKEQLISMEEVKRTTAVQVSVARESLDNTSSQLTELNDKLARLTYQLDEEKRKKRLAEERYTSQQEEYEAAVRRRQKELDELNWSKIDLEKAVKDKERELERLRMQLEEEATRRRGAEQEISKTSMIVQKSQTHYTEILSDRDALLIKLKQLEQDKSHQGHYKEELNRIKVSLETELRNKQRLQEERDKMQKDFTYWKSQYELKETQMRQSDSDKGKMERERLSLKSELERMIVELRTVEERYKGRLQSSEREVSDLALKRDALEKELRRRQQRPDSMSIQTQTDEKVVTPMTVQGLRGEVSVTELINSNLLSETDVQKLNQGKLSSKDIEDKLKNYLHGSNCIAGIYDEANNRAMTFYQAMKDGLLRQGTTLELLEAQAASGFMIDPVNNVCLTVDEAWKRGLVGKEFKDKLMSAERAVTGYKDPHTGKTISLFQAIEKDLIEKGHGIRLLEAQIASGGIIDPKESHRIDVDIAYKRGYFDEEMNEILSYEGDDTKGFFDPNTQENLTYLQLKERCITDPKTGLVLLPLRDKTKPQQTVQQSSQNTILRKRRVVIVDPDTGIEMTVREAYHKELIDYDTFLSLSEQECEWEEITITASDGSARLVVVDRKTGTQYDIQDSLDRGIIDQTSLEQYRSGTLTLPQFADLITSNSNLSELTMTARNMEDVATCSSPPQARPSSPTVRKRFNNISIIFSPPEEFDEGSPVAAIFDTETMEKITIPEALRRGLVDAITAQRLLEAQACTGGIINPTNGQRLNLQDAVHQSIIDNDMATKLKPAQKAFMGFEDMKTKRKMSAAEAMKEKWLPYEAGQRFLEFQYLTGGLLEPGTGQQTSIEEAIRRGWLDGRGAQKLQDTRSHAKNLTCPKTKLKISYKEAMDSCMVEEGKGMKMLQASSISTKGISSPYNVSNPGSRSGSRTGSRTGSRSGSRRGSVDYSSSYKKRVWS